jgi:hypothetical protein
MKVQSNPTPMPVKKTRVQKDPSGTLSNEAFYLIALALLLKKETGRTSLRQHLLPKDIIRTTSPTLVRS